MAGIFQCFRSVLASSIGAVTLMSIAVTASLTLSSASVSAGQTWFVGVSDHSYPFSYYDEKKGRYAGFDVDIANALCNEMKIQCVLAPLNMVDMLNAIEADRVQMVVNGWRPLTGRFSDFKFSNPYFRSQLVFISAKDDCPARITPTTKLDLTAGVLVHSGQEQLLNEVYVPNGMKVKPYVSIRSMFRAMMKGEVDVLFVTGIVAYGFMKQPGNDKVRFIGMHPKLPPEQSNRRIVLSRSASPYLKKLNDALLAIKNDGRYQAINMKHFHIMVH